MATKPIVGPSAMYSENRSMVDHRSFGRRGDPQRQPSRAKAFEAVAQSTRVEFHRTFCRAAYAAVEKPRVLTPR